MFLNISRKSASNVLKIFLNIVISQLVCTGLACSCYFLFVQTNTEFN